MWTCTVLFFQHFCYLKTFKTKAVLSSPLPTLPLSVSSPSAHTSINARSVQVMLYILLFPLHLFWELCHIFQTAIQSSTINSDHLDHCDTKVTIQIFTTVITCIVIAAHCSFAGAGSLNGVPVFVQDVLGGLNLCAEPGAGIICRERSVRELAPFGLHQLWC